MVSFLQLRQGRSLSHLTLRAWQPADELVIPLDLVKGTQQGEE